jgi:uncharacterized membrane protein (UPF0127 family)
MGIIAEQWLIDECVQLSVHRATGLRRLTGLIGRASLPQATALHLPRCRSVHGFGMARTIDVVFVSSAGRVTSVHGLAPLRLIGDRAASSAFELCSGEARRLGIAIGTSLRQQIEGEL